MILAKYSRASYMPSVISAGSPRPLIFADISEHCLVYQPTLFTASQLLLEYRPDNWQLWRVTCAGTTWNHPFLLFEHFSLFFSSSCSVTSEYFIHIQGIMCHTRDSEELLTALHCLSYLKPNSPRILRGKGRLAELLDRWGRAPILIDLWDLQSLPVNIRNSWALKLDW